MLVRSASLTAEAQDALAMDVVTVGPVQLQAPRQLQVRARAQARAPLERAVDASVEAVVQGAQISAR